MFLVFCDELLCQLKTSLRNICCVRSSLRASAVRMRMQNHRSWLKFYPDGDHVWSKGPGLFFTRKNIWSLNSILPVIGKGSGINLHCLIYANALNRKKLMLWNFPMVAPPGDRLHPLMTSLCHVILARATFPNFETKSQKQPLSSTYRATIYHFVKQQKVRSTSFPEMTERVE